MGLDVSNYNNSVPFIRYSNPGALKLDGIIAQDAARTTPILPYTVLSKILLTGKYVPLTDIDPVEDLDNPAPAGMNIPSGIYIGPPINAAMIAAGDYTDCQILTGAAFIDKNQVILENNLSQSTIIPALQVTVEDALNWRGLFFEDTIDISSQENV